MSVYPAALPTVRPAVRSAFEQGSGGGAASIIAGLFAQGQQGFWLPFTDFASLSQDSAGTLPYTAVEQPVGRVLDRSGRGNHASQATSTARGVVSARVNQLVSTGSFSGLYWDKLGPSASVVAADVASPLGGMADKIVLAATGAEWSQCRQLGSAIVGVTYASKILIKAAAPVDVGKIIGWRHVGSDAFGLITLSADWSWVSKDEVAALTSREFTLSLRPSVGTSSGTVSFHLAAADLRLASQSALPYQRVNTPTDYDSIGFPKYLTFDGVDDRLQATLPAITGTWIAGYEEGTLVYKVNIPAGAFPIGTNTNASFHTPSKNFAGMVLRAGDLTDVEVSAVERYLVANGAGAAGADAFAGVGSFNSAWANCSSLTSFPLINTAAGTNFQSSWNGCSSLTSFPTINTAAGTNFVNAWKGCSSLTSFPLINTAAGTNFNFSWQNCSSLTSFPANMFDSCQATNFTGAFQNCALSQVSVDGILASLVTAGKSNGTLNMHSGTSSTPSAAGLASKATLVSRGWTVTHN